MERVAEKRVTCKECQTKQTILYAATKGPAQMGLQRVGCAECGNEMELEVPGTIVDGPFVESSTAQSSEPRMGDELGQNGGDSAELHD